MKFQLMVSVLFLCATVLGCAAAKPNDGFEDPHRACYAFTYGEDGVGIDYEKALSWCREGAMDGSLSSTTLLAELHYNGHGTPKDIEKASKIYELAAELGHVHAQWMVFKIYFTDPLDTATCEQKQRGFEYLKEAAESGYERAIETLAIFNDAIRESKSSNACVA